MNAPSSSAPNSLSNGALDPAAAAKKRRVVGSGAGSDTDAAIYSDGGVMSDGSKAKRIKLKMSSSSAGGRSPPTMTPQGGSRSGSPRPSVAPASRTPAAFPTLQEIRDAIPVEGISIAALISRFQHPKERRTEFINQVKEVSRFDKETKLLMPKSHGAGIGGA